MARTKLRQRQSKWIRRDVWLLVDRESGGKIKTLSVEGCNGGLKLLLRSSTIYTTPEQAVRDGWQRDLF